MKPYIAYLIGDNGAGQLELLEFITRIPVQRLNPRSVRAVFRKEQESYQLWICDSEAYLDTVFEANEYLAYFLGREVDEIRLYIPSKANFELRTLSLENLDALAFDDNYAVVVALRGPVARSACYYILHQRVVSFEERCIVVYTDYEEPAGTFLLPDYLLDFLVKDVARYQAEAFARYYKLLEQVEEKSTQLSDRFKNYLMIALMYTEFAFSELQPIDVDIIYKDVAIKSRSFDLMRFDFEDGRVEVRVGGYICVFRQKLASVLHIFKYWIKKNRERHLLYSDDGCEFVHALEIFE